MSSQVAFTNLPLKKKSKVGFLSKWKPEEQMESCYGGRLGDVGEKWKRGPVTAEKSKADAMEVHPEP